MNEHPTPPKRTQARFHLVVVATTTLEQFYIDYCEGLYDNRTFAAVNEYGQCMAGIEARTTTGGQLAFTVQWHGQAQPSQHPAYMEISIETMEAI